ncbi:MAG: SAM-dependent methyltransferase, partial [Candidatus Margulisbacteria bacterium]|nr:SAM-dependent methyltransferase [Candidatus Margulisiibacteriota bacterium]
DHPLSVVPFLDNKPRGVFATRAPNRPNSIGLSIVKLIKIEKNILYIENIDAVDGTPLLDIKPYVKEFKDLKEVNIGWLTGKDNKFKNFKADKRFK